MKMKETIFDIETNGFLDVVKDLHVVSWQESNDTEQKSSPSEEAFEEVFDTDLLIGHFIIGYDLPAIKKMFGIEPKKEVIVVDTLILSWYLDTDRKSYGLESYGETFGIPKPKIVDWENQTYEDYKFRCEQDVRINTRQWKRCRAKLAALYGLDEHGNLSKDALRLIRYLGFKMKCAFDQGQERIRLDYDLASKTLKEITTIRDEKYEQLVKSMPKHALTKRVLKPKNIYKKDGALSEAGKRWFAHLEGAGLPKTTAGPINVITGYEEGNPGSPQQIKDWLGSLGWKPTTYKFTRSKVTGKEKMVPQVRDKGELCDSVKELQSKDPAIEYLEGVTVLNHRISVFNGFIEKAEYDNGEYWVRAGVTGLTNTFRFTHGAPIVNLPGVDKLYGKEIRSCLMAPSDDHLVCGADMTSLEDTTKRHYMQPLDPDYVAEMSVDGFDPHLNLAEFAGAITHDEYNQYADKVDEVVKKLSPIRKKFKAVNYSATYGVGKVTLARDSGMSEPEAAKLLKAYWERNWAIKKIATTAETKVLKDGSLWVFNPVSGFWMSLRNFKDIFSTLNQSTGVFVFDTWLHIVISKGMPIILQMHDEYLGYFKKGQEAWANKLNEEAIVELNQRLQLNVELGSDWEFGDNYASVH